MLQTMTGSVNGKSAVKGVLPRRQWTLAAFGFALALLMLSAGLVQAGGKNPNTAKYWKGKNIAEATKKFGDPTQATPLIETGGNLYIFALRGQQHWVFETNNIGVIVKAAKVE
jgi:hypothetical protein